MEPRLKMNVFAVLLWYSILQDIFNCRMTNYELLR